MWIDTDLMSRKADQSSGMFHWQNEQERNNMKQLWIKKILTKVFTVEQLKSQNENQKSRDDHSRYQLSSGIISCTITEKEFQRLIKDLKLRSKFSNNKGKPNTWTFPAHKKQPETEINT
jgi:hypothetical protein